MSPAPAFYDISQVYLGFKDAELAEKTKMRGKMHILNSVSSQIPPLCSVDIISLK